jgi:two-component system chemotaxis sensor kinase CheA
MKSSKKEFVAEAEELIEESHRLILEIQDSYSTGLNPDTINALFRSMHTLKGVSGLFGLQGITNLSHSLETIMDEARLGKIEINAAFVNFLFTNLDILRELIEKVARGEDEGDVGGFIRDIETFTEALKAGPESGGGAEAVDESIMRVLSEYEEHRLRASIKDGKGIYLARTVFTLDVFDKALEEVTRRIKTRGELISTLPTSTDIPDGSIGFNLLFSSTGSRDEAAKGLQLDIETLVAPRATPAAPAPAAPKQTDTHLKSTSTTVRVDIDKLDRVLNTIGELTLAKGAVRRIGLEVAEQYGLIPLVHDINKISQTLERRLAELQDQVLEIRMVPIGQIFSRLAQVVRRYAKEIGKQIELVMYGEDTEIDKFLAEEIVDPLMHLVRNAMDHGIEPVGERRKKGKPESGAIILKAYQKGNHVVIEVQDDGAGISVEKVKKKAVEKGLIDGSDTLDEKKVIDLIFAPGFSTKEVVSEVSGRGVGLDVVREKLSGLGGFTEIDTEKDVGTTFVMTLPITLAIIKALIVRVGEERFAVPLTSMSETLIIEHRDIQTVEGKEVSYLRGEMLPIVRVNRFFGLSGDDSDRSFAVVIGFGDRRVGLLVDELFGQQEIVIKSIGDYLRKLRGFAGAAETGKHEVVLVLDVESLIDESVIKQKGGAYV